MHIQANFLQKRAFHSLQKVALSSSENGSSSTEETLGEKVFSEALKAAASIPLPVHFNSVTNG